MTTDINKTFDAIDSELASLMSVGTSADSLVMNQTQFVHYCQEQIALAKAGEDAENRVAHLKEIVSLAKKEGWEETDTQTVSVYSGELSVQSQSRWKEKMEAGFTPPGPEGVPTSGGFENGGGGPTGPASNTAAPAGRYMPPAFPQATPAASAEGFIAKADAFKENLAKAHGGEALIAEFNAMLGAETTEGAPAIEAVPVQKDDGWPKDLAAESFLNGTEPVAAADDFGADPSPV